MTTHILAVFPSIMDGTSWYRGAGPLSHLVRNYDVFLHTPTQISWPDVCRTHIVFIQRACAENHVEIMDLALNCNRPVWIDYDDDLFGVPRDNPAYAYYAKPETKQRLLKLLTNATVVTCSTQRIADLYKTHVDREYIVIPNAWDFQTIPYHPLEEPLNRVWWRGSNSHFGNLCVYQQPINQLMDDLPDTEFVFSCEFEFVIPRLFKRPMLTERKDVIQWLRTFRQGRPKVMMVVMEDNEFNQCRSNIAWMEGTYAGAVVIVPKTFSVFPYCTYPFSTPEELVRLVKFWIEKPTRSNLVEQSRDLIKAQLSLDIVNRMRFRLLERMLNAGPVKTTKQTTTQTKNNE